jgi:hypothetical protein
VETANVNRFSSTTQVDGQSRFEKAEPLTCTHKLFSTTRPLEEVSQHRYAYMCIKTSIRQNGTGKYTMHSEMSASPLRTD